MAVSRGAVTQPTTKTNGTQPKATKGASPGRGTRADGSGSTTPKER